jgi:hypothetical protein
VESRLVPQDVALYETTARANLQLFGALYGCRAPRSRGRSPHTGAGGLPDRAGDKVASFSGGRSATQYRRRAARSGVDLLTSPRWALIRVHNAMSTTSPNCAGAARLVYTTHYMEAAPVRSIVVMDHGGSADDTLPGLLARAPAPTAGTSLARRGRASRGMPASTASRSTAARSWTSTTCLRSPQVLQRIGSGPAVRGFANERANSNQFS